MLFPLSLNTGIFTICKFIFSYSLMTRKRISKDLLLIYHKETSSFVSEQFRTVFSQILFHDIKTEETSFFVKKNK